jgi:multicomponent Na+:H+ antiporter subunit A
MFMLILQRLPVFAKLSSKATKIRDGAIALVFGSAMTLLALKAIHVDFNNPISDYFMNNSYDKAFGKNVVNVILVDFRAFDTLGRGNRAGDCRVGVSVLLTSKNKKV